MAGKKRSILIEGNPALDRVAHRFAAKIRSLTRLKKELNEEVAEIDRKLTEAQNALRALKAGA